MKSFHEEWERIHSTQEWGKYPSEQVVRFVARNYYKSDRKQIRILDFGCGAGANTWFLAREGFDVYAFDGSKSAVKRAAEYLNAEGCRNVKFAVMDGAEIEYEDQFFDCVIDSACIYANTTDNICRMYAQVYRVLKEGGRIFSSCFGTKTDGVGTGELLETGTYENVETGVLAGRAIVHYFTQSEFEGLLKENGFKDVWIDTMQYTDQGTSVEMFFAKAVK